MADEPPENNCLLLHDAAHQSVSIYLSLVSGLTPQTDNKNVGGKPIEQGHQTPQLLPGHTKWQPTASPV